MYITSLVTIGSMFRYLGNIRSNKPYQKSLVEVRRHLSNRTSQVSRTKPTLYNKNEITLKYDPFDASKPNLFTSYGILPFLQSKINEMLGKGNSIDGNFAPTQAQKLITSVLGSQHSIVHRSNEAQTGRTLGIATYAVNFSLTRFPNFGILSHRSTIDSIDSIILVPTDKMVPKVKAYIDSLQIDIPVNACPDRYIDGKFTRRPLKVEYYTQNGSEYTLSNTNNLENSTNRIPHILVTTPHGLNEVMMGSSTSTTKRDNLNDVRFVAADNFDMMVNCTDVLGAFNFTTYGKKQKLLTKVEKSIKDLQDLQIKRYVDQLYSRLSHVEKKFKKSNEALKADSFDYAELVLNDNSLSIGDVDSLVESKLSEGIILNSSLLKKLVKAKRQALYKPIQYCFTIEAKDPLFQTLMRSNTLQDNNLLLENIYQQQQQILHSRPGVDTSFQNNYNQFLDEKGANVSHKRDSEDPFLAYIEKLIRFDDTKRFYRNKERKILTVGSSTTPKHKVNTSFVECTKKGEVIDIDVTTALPSNSDTIKSFAKDSEASNNNVLNYHKQYLKQKFASAAIICHRNTGKSLQGLKNTYTKSIISTIDLFRKENPSNTKPFIIVVPEYIKLKNFKKGKESYHMITKKGMKGVGGGSKEDTKHLIVHPIDLKTQSMLCFHNMAIFSLDSLLPQLAWSNYKSPVETVSNIAGIKDPVSDLFSFYLSHIQNHEDTECERNVIVNLMQADNLDLQRLSSIILYNNLKDRVKLVNLGEKNPISELKYGSSLGDIPKNNSLVSKYSKKLSNMFEAKS